MLVFRLEDMSDRRETILECVDGVRVRTPKLKSRCTTGFPILEKPDWIPNEETKTCMECQVKFSAIKRRHHCRCCGKLFCGRCCFKKISLPHFGMDDDQKVCKSCHHISQLIAKCTSTDTVEKQEGFYGLQQLLSSSTDFCKVVESGGLHVMMAVAIGNDATVMELASSALHDVAQKITFNPFLIEIGALNVLKSCLLTGSESCSLLSKSLDVLNLMCKDVQIRNKASEVIELIIPLLRISGLPAFLAAEFFRLFLSYFDVHELILQDHPQMIPSLLKAAEEKDVKLQSAITKVLVYLTAGSETARHLIFMEDEEHGHPLLCLLRSTSDLVLQNTSCVVANLATVQKEEVGKTYVTALCDLLLIVSDEFIGTVTHLGRGLANFAEMETNHVLLLPHISAVVTRLLKTGQDSHKYHACRLMLSVLSSKASNPSCFSDGLEDFLETVLLFPQVADCIRKSLLLKVSKLSVIS